MKIICIGRNYADHAKELNNPIPEDIVFFMKPETALLQKNNPFFYPDFSQDVHHEVEVVIRINKHGKYIEERFAHKYFDQVGVGVDFTARDVQKKCKEKGLPWEKAKAFDQSAPASKMKLLSEVGDINNLNFHLEINGQTVQEGNTSQMIYSCAQIIAEVSKYVMLKKGDLIFTGTPAGVGPVKIDDHVQAYLEGELLLDFNVK